MDPTPYHDVNALIEAMRSDLRATLGTNLVGLYVFGSIATGQFEDETSDVDLVVALAADLTADEFARLALLHAEIVRRYPRWDDRIEIGYIALDKLRRLRSESAIALISPGEPFHVKEAGIDWLINLFMLRERGLTLFGPPPPTLIDPITNDDLVGGVQQLMREWREWITQTELIHRRSYQGHMIITMCRNLYLWKNHEVAAKRQAAAWAAQALPEWSSLILDALAWRETRDDEQIDGDATLPEALRFVHITIETILAGSAI